MWYKVSWLTFWVSMTLWVGTFWGCAAPGDDQNYRAHADGGGLYERENHDRPRDPEQKGIIAGVQDAIGAAPARNNQSNSSVTDRGPEGEAGTEGESGDVVADAVVADATESETEYAGDGLPAETGPSITSLDRSSWKKIKVGVVVGQTTHNPIYYKDCPADRAGARIDFSQSIDDQLAASLDGAGSKQWDKHHSWQVVAQPLKYAFDTIVLPVRVVMQHPWTKIKSP